MPIKLPKGFSRRKSSGQILEEVQNPPQPSFRVFERPPSKSFDGGVALKRMSQGRPLSAGQFQEENLFADQPSDPIVGNRGSGGTHGSSSTGGLFDISSSPRYSSASTLPSSSSLEAVRDEFSHAHPKTPQTPYNLPPLPISQNAQPVFSLRAAGRTFSFGRKAAQAAQQQERITSNRNAHTTYADIPDIPDIGRAIRPRAMTETSYASASTATPPKLLGTDMDFGHSDGTDGFANMFAEFGDRTELSGSPEKVSEMKGRDGSAQLAPVPASPQERLPFTPPPPLDVDRNRPIGASPYSTESQTSRDGLMSFAFSEDRDEQNHSPFPADRKGFSKATSIPSITLDRPNFQTRLQQPATIIRQNDTYTARRNSTPLQYADTLPDNESINPHSVRNRRSTALTEHLVRTPIQLDRRQNREYFSADSAFLPKTPQNIPRDTPAVETPVQESPQYMPVTLVDGGPSAESSSSWQSDSADVTPRAVRRVPSFEPDDPLLLDPTFQEMARSADQYQVKNISPPRNPVPSKVMTPAQFERYRKEQDLLRSKSNASKSDTSDDGSDDYDYEDDAERNRQLAKQRRKQEAHLAVYRQQMMKVTGEQAPDQLGLRQHRPGLDTPSLSAPNLSWRASTLSLTGNKATSNGKSSDDDDEDIPLGILAAHGFPSKDRPPTRLSMPGSSPNIRYTSETYPPPPAHAASGSTAGRGARGGLPPFARNLPKDPYYGASIVNPLNRETPGFGVSGSSSAYGGSPAGLPPGGLVGVIASEEKARALRRGSPNTQGRYLPSTSTMPLPPGMAPPGVVSPDSAQMQLSQQMNQMMAMQMQWMQQMMVMQGMPSGQQLPPPMPYPPQQPSLMNGGFLAPSGGGPMPRPMTMSSLSVPAVPGMGPHQPRARSMLGPDMMGSQWTPRDHRRSVAPPGMMMMGGADLASSGAGYAASIAPSGRSSVGMPSRYRPVSIGPVEEMMPATAKSVRASTMVAVQPGPGGVHWVPSGGDAAAAPTIKIVGSSTHKVGSEEEEDEEEGWEEMKKRVEKRKSSWRQKRGKEDGAGEGLSDIGYQAFVEGLK